MGMEIGDLSGDRPPEWESAMRKDDQGELAVRHGVGERVAQLVCRARTGLADAWARHVLRRELADYELNSDFDLALADVGLTRAQLQPVIKGHPEAARLLETMAERLGVEQEYTKDPIILREMQLTCSLCAAHSRCRHWLRAERTDGYQNFCPNADLLNFLRHRKAMGVAAKS